MTQDEPQPRWGNRLLDTLPDQLQQGIGRRLKRLTIGRGTVTTLAGEPLEHVDFPIDAVIAVIACTPSGKTIEVAVVGNEGYVETDAPLESEIAHRTSLWPATGQRVADADRRFPRLLAR